MSFAVSVGLAILVWSPETASLAIGLEVAAGRLLDGDPVGAAEALAAVA